MVKDGKLTIDVLNLWDENARFPDKYFNSEEEELIKYFIAKPEFKLKELIDNIIKDFDLPQLEKIVVWLNEDKYYVLEGNRRLTAYKVLANPYIIKNTELQDYILEKKKSISIDNSFLIDCIITDDKESGYRYIERKHINGNNVVNWKDNERAHHNVRRGSNNELEHIKIGITRKVKEINLPESMKDKVLGQGFVTTFFRLVTTGPAKKIFGIKLDDDNNLTVKDKDFDDKLKVLMYHVLTKKDFNGKAVDTRELNKSNQIEQYLKSLKKDDAERVDKEIKDKTVEDIFGEKEVKLGNVKLGKSGAQKSRSKAMPSGLFHASDIPFKVGNSSLRILYDELKDIDVDRFPNAAHDLLRSFLECSLIVFFKKHNEYDTIQKNDKHNPTLGEMLTHIINNKSIKINNANLIETLKHVKTDYSSQYSLERMNMINHNENWASAPKDVRVAWAKMEELFKILLS